MTCLERIGKDGLVADAVLDLDVPEQAECTGGEITVVARLVDFQPVGGRGKRAVPGSDVKMVDDQQMGIPDLGIEPTAT